MARGDFVHSRRLPVVVGIALMLVLVVGPIPSSRGWAAPEGRTRGEGQQSVRAESSAVSAQGGTEAPRQGVQFYGGAISDDTYLNYVADAGAGVIRWPAPWSSVEPSNTTPENYNWSWLDTAVTKATNRGVELILTISGQPSWAAEYAMGPPYDPADLVEFVDALVERYDGDGIDDAPGAPRVRYFELYNEPDNYDTGRAKQGGYGYWGKNGEGYAQLLQILYPVVKSASPDAQLVFGGIARDWCSGGGFDCGFLDDVLEVCEGHDCFDVMNFHYFPYYRSNWESYGPDIIGKTNYIRQRLDAYGFGDKPLICSETSWEGATDLGSDELQSRYMAKGFARGLAADLDTVVWFSLLDGGDPKRRGLIDDNRQPKPSYQAYDTMTTMLAGATFERALTSSDTGSSQLVGYRFDRSGHRMDVVWTEDSTPYDADDDPVLPLTVSAESLRKVDKYGNEEWISDEDDGVTDGQITLDVGGSPLYLDYAQPGAPAASFTTSSPDWLGQTTTFTNTSTGDEPISYSWDFGDGMSSSSKDPTHAYADPGTYTVALAASNALGEAVSTGSVTIYSTPEVSVSSSSPAFLGQAVSFAATATSTPPGDPSIELTWDFGDGTVRSGGAVTEHTYDSPGTYTVEVTAENPAGEDVASDTVTIYNQLVAAFTTSSPDWLGETTTFTNTTTGDEPITYSWDFGDGTTSSLENPTHAYAEAGTYTVVLTAHHVAGEDVATDTVTIYGPPTAAFTTSSPDWLGQTTAFTNATSGQDPISYEWDFGDGTTSSLKHPAHAYAEAGTYTVALTATNEAGEDVASGSVTVYSAPQVTVSTSSPDFAGQPTSFTATVTTTPPGDTSVELTWDFGDGTVRSGGTTTQHTYDSSGTYTVEVTAENPAGQGVASDTVIIHNELVAAFTTSSPDWLGQTTTFTNTTTGDEPITYSWDFGDGTTSSLENPMHAYAEAGSYTVVLTAHHVAGEDVAIDTVTIYSAPQVTVSTGSPDNLGETTGFTATVTTTPSGDPSVELTWDFGDGTVRSEGTTTQHTYDSPGTYTVEVTVENPAGQDVATDIVTIYADLVAGFTSSSPDWLGETTTFTNTTTGDEPISYSWDFGDGTTSSLKHPTHAYAEAGSYTVVLTAHHVAGDDVVTDTVTIYGPPTAAFTTSSPDWLGQTTAFTNATSGDEPISYSWDFGDGTTSSLKHPTHAYAEAGTYSVVLTATNAAGEDVASDSVTVYNAPQVTVSTSSPDFAGQPTSFTATVTTTPPGDTSVELTWDFGDGTVRSGGATTEYTYDSPGTYTVEVTAENPAGQDVTSDAVIIYDELVAAFTTSSPDWLGETTTFTNTTSGDEPVTYSWDFDDGAISSLKHPTHAYAEPGYYTVTLKASIGGASTVATRTITIYGPPEADFVASPVEGTAPLAVAFMANATTLPPGDPTLMYHWDFGDGATSAAPNPEHSYEAAGTYTVTLEVTNAAGTDIVTKHSYVVVKSKRIYLPLIRLDG